MAGAESRDRLIEKLRRELGPVVLKALDDPHVVEVMLNEDGTLWEDRLGADMKPIGTMTDSQALNLICTVAGMIGVEAKSSTPIVEGELPLDGSRFEGIIPPVVERPVFAIRMRAVRIFAFDDYIRTGIMNEDQLAVLIAHIDQRHNILVVGATGSGKTTFCNAILDYIARKHEDGRIGILEDTRELQCAARNKFCLRTTEHIGMVGLLRATLRMRPDRIVVGEVRDRAALTLIKAWNTGHSGGVATVHANSAESGLTRIEQLIEEANVRAVKAVIAEAINCIVSIQRTKEGRKVQEIVTVLGATRDGYRLQIASQNVQPLKGVA